MSKQTVVQEFCDVCTRESTWNEKCVVCKRDCCLLCKYSSAFAVHICKKCVNENPVAKAIIDRFVKTWNRYNARINAELAKVKPVKAKAAKA